jgi:hypothetical protein
MRVAPRPRPPASQPRPDGASAGWAVKRALQQACHSNAGRQRRSNTAVHRWQPMALLPACRCRCRCRCRCCRTSAGTARPSPPPKCSECSSSCRCRARGKPPTTPRARTGVRAVRGIVRAPRGRGPALVAQPAAQLPARHGRPGYRSAAQGAAGQACHDRPRGTHVSSAGTSLLPGSTVRPERPRTHSRSSRLWCACDGPGAGCLSAQHVRGLFSRARAESGCCTADLGRRR